MTKVKAPFKNFGQYIIFADFHQSISKCMLWQYQKCPIQEVSNLFAFLKLRQLFRTEINYFSAVAFDLHHCRQAHQTV